MSRVLHFLRNSCGWIFGRLGSFVGRLKDSVFGHPTKQCCKNFLDAAKRGCLPCLQRMADAGDFLPLNHPNRVSAGEARKLEVWDAALAACMEGRTQVLEWMFRDGWPQAVDAMVPWDMWDTLDEWNAKDYLKQVENDVIIRNLIAVDFLEVEAGTAISLAEWRLYRAAMAEPTLACLAVLLESGCRSLWLCRAAAHENNIRGLRMAASHGCPCDVWNIFIATSNNNEDLLQAVYQLANLKLELAKRVMQISSEHAAARGYIACLKRLFTDEIRTSSGELLRWTPDIRASDRLGAPHPLWILARAAVIGGHLDCLKCLVQKVGIENLPGRLAGVSAGSGHVPCCDYLLNQGYMVCEDDLRYMICAGPSAEALQQWLPNVPVSDNCLGELMVRACSMMSPECINILYGFDTHRTVSAVAAFFAQISEHPVNCALQRGNLDCVRVVVSRHRAPLNNLDLQAAGAGGEDLLRYVHMELGAPLDVRATHGAARRGQVGALQYALEHEAPWQDIEVFDAAVTADSLACLRLLHDVATKDGYPAGFFVQPYGADNERASPAVSLAVLQYIHETMRGSPGNNWANQVVTATAKALEDEATMPLFSKLHYYPRNPVDWQMVLYLAKEMNLQDHHPTLHAMAEKRRKRAIGLARAFQAAAKKGDAEQSRWLSMGKVPTEVVELIAFKAHLALQPKGRD